MSKQFFHFWLATDVQATFFEKLQLVFGFVSRVRVIRLFIVSNKVATTHCVK